MVTIAHPARLELLAYGPGPGDGWRHMDGWGFGWMWLFGLLLLLGLLVGGAVLAFALLRGTRGAGGGSGAPGGGGSARDILDQRYARGELTTEEYRERLREIG
jgi:putative membrane protein